MSKAAKLLDSHHGSSSGKMAGRTVDWLCNKCIFKDGEHFRNLAFRTHCRECRVHKGKCHLRDAPRGKEPTVRVGGIAAKQLAQKKQADKQELAKELGKVKKENAKLKKQKNQQVEEPAAVEKPEDDFMAKIKNLEVQKSFCEDHPEFEDKLPSIEAKLRDLRAEKAAKIPQGERLKRAEAELQKRKKQLAFAREATEAAKKALEECQQKEVEAIARAAEAEAEHERIRSLIGPKPEIAQAFTKSAVDGAQDILKMLSAESLQKLGCSQEQKQLLDGVLGMLPAIMEQERAAAAERKADEEAEVAKRLAEEEAAGEAKKPPSNDGLPVGGAGDVTMQGVASDPTADRLQQLAGSSNAEEADAARIMLATLGIPRKERSTPY